MRQDEPFYVEITVASNKAGEGYIDIYRGDILHNQDSPKVKSSGRNQVPNPRFDHSDKQVEYVARVREFNDTLLDNNSASAIVFASGKPTVLLVDSNAEQTNDLRWALEEQGLIVQTRPIEGVPQTLTEMQRFDCLILSNVPATSMSLQQMEIIRTYVQDLGGGLVMLGAINPLAWGLLQDHARRNSTVRSNFEKEKKNPAWPWYWLSTSRARWAARKLNWPKMPPKVPWSYCRHPTNWVVIAFDGDAYGSASYIPQPTWATSSITSALSKPVVGPRFTLAIAGIRSATVRCTRQIEACHLLTDGISTPGDFEGIARDMVTRESRFRASRLVASPIPGSWKS